VLFYLSVYFFIEARVVSNMFAVVTALFFDIYIYIYIYVVISTLIRKVMVVVLL
jgi:hypothetical protein